MPAKETDNSKTFINTTHLMDLRQMTNTLDYKLENKEETQNKEKERKIEKTKRAVRGAHN